MNEYYALAMELAGYDERSAEERDAGYCEQYDCTEYQSPVQYEELVKYYALNMFTPARYSLDEIPF